MEKKIECRYKVPNKNNRLTVAVDRVTMKFIDLPEDTEWIEEFFLEIAEDLKDTDCTLRGALEWSEKFETFEVSMRSNCGEHFKKYIYE